MFIETPCTESVLNLFRKYDLCLELEIGDSNQLRKKAKKTQNQLGKTIIRNKNQSINAINDEFKSNWKENQLKGNQLDTIFNSDQN